MKEAFKHNLEVHVINPQVEYGNFVLICTKFKKKSCMALTGCKALLVLPAFPPELCFTSGSQLGLFRKKQGRKPLEPSTD